MAQSWNSRIVLGSDGVYTSKKSISKRYLVERHESGVRLGLPTTARPRLNVGPAVTEVKELPGRDPAGLFGW
jgi:hypothetical protein